MKNASVFWKELKSLGEEKRSDVSTQIDINEWYNHFKSILGPTFNETADKLINVIKTTRFFLCLRFVTAFCTSSAVIFVFRK